jgi:hypothetical protein
MVRGECSSAIDLRIRLSVESAGLGHHLGDPFRPTLIPSHKRKRIPVCYRLSRRAGSGQRGSAPLRERTQSRPGWVAALPGRRFGYSLRTNSISKARRPSRGIFSCFSNCRKACDQPDGWKVIPNSAALTFREKARREPPKFPFIIGS